MRTIKGYATSITNLQRNMLKPLKQRSIPSHGNRKDINKRMGCLIYPIAQLSPNRIIFYKLLHCYSSFQFLLLNIFVILNSTNCSL